MQLGSKVLIKAILIFLSALSFHGCASTQQQLEHGPIFWPSLPAEPHIQYLSGFSSSTDVEGEKAGFSLIVTGKEAPTFIKQIGKASGITAHNGKLYISSTSFGLVVIIDIANKTFDYLEGKGSSAKLKKPINTTLDDQGNIYVADAGRNQIVVFDAAGSYLRALGNFADNSRIVDVDWFKGKLYALDSKTSLIRVLDPVTGDELASFGNGESERKNNLALPFALTIDEGGTIYISNIGSGRVLKYDIDGNFLDGLGRLGSSFGEFSRPRGVAVNPAGQLYAVDAGFSNVQVFNKENRLLGFFGTPGQPAGSLNMPAGIAVTTDNLDYYQEMAAPGFKLEEIIYVVNQYTTTINSAISVYGLGSMK